MNGEIPKRLAGAFLVGGCLGLAGQVFYALWQAVLGADAALAMPAALVTLGVVGGTLYVFGAYQKIEKIGAIGAAMPFSGLVSAVAGMFIEGSRDRGAVGGIAGGLKIFAYVLGVGSLLAAVIGAVAALALGGGAR